MIFDPWVVFYDGLVSLGKQIVPLVVFFIAAWGVGALAFRLVPATAKEGGAWFLLTLGLGCSLLPVLVLLLMLLVAMWPALIGPGSYTVLLLALAGLVLELPVFKLKRRWFSQPGMAVLAILAVFLLMVIRLAYLRRLLLPPYDDSPEHYLIIKDFLLPAESPQSFYLAANWLTHYYHLGFHGLTAWLTYVTSSEIGANMALLGQFFLLVTPLSVYAFTTVTTHDRTAAWMAALFAAIGWRMPAFAVNWGKYPALMAIACLPAVLSLLVYVRSGRRLWIAFLLAACSLFLVHTRLGICIFLGFAAFILAKIIPLRRPLKFWEAALLALLFIPAVFLLQDPLIYVYSAGWYFALGLVVFCLPFALWRFPRFSAGLWLCLMGIGLFARLELPESLQSYSITLLDRTFVEILLFLPLSLLAGAGLAGMLAKIGSHPAWRWAVAGLVILFLVVIFWLRGSFYPDRCCNYVSAGDLDALAWIQNETPPDAVVLVAGFEMRNYLAAVDGGGWVQAMTGRNMNKVRYHLNWGSESARELVCKKEWGEPYIYAGGMEFSFVRDLLFKPEWYKVVFESRGVRIYKVQNCQGPAP